MGSKFNRRYKLAVEGVNITDVSGIAGSIGLEAANAISAGNITIEYPLTVDFTIERKAGASSANTASFVVYNLNDSTRKKIFKDQIDTTSRRAIQFSAGYDTGGKGTLPMVFNGEVRYANSRLEGPNFLTEIDCYAGGFGMANGFTSMSAGAGTPIDKIVAEAAKNFPGLEKLTQGKENAGDVIKRGAVFMGNTYDILKNATNGNFYVDNGIGYAIGKNEVTQGEIQVLSSDSGLLGTPRRGDAVLEVTMLFEPRLQLFQYVKLDSSTERNYNGEYKVVGITHKGTISGSVGGTCTTVATLLTLKTFRFI